MILFQMNYDSFQDTVEKPLDLNPETLNPFRYLTMNSTNGTAEINGKNSTKSISNLNRCFNKSKIINCVLLHRLPNGLQWCVQKRPKDQWNLLNQAQSIWAFLCLLWDKCW